jgi:aspartyl-tRNA(Asn)/glutamyl-tRNA(Gln) amidotransferase subunit C
MEKDWKLLDYEKVLNLASQLRVDLTPEEAKRIASDLSKILEYVGELEKLDLSKVEPTYTLSVAKNVLREDRLEDTLSQSNVLKNAVFEGNFIKAPRV